MKVKNCQKLHQIFNLFRPAKFG